MNEATKLTKGAIYCNFANKEELAIKAFRHNVKEIIAPLIKAVEKQEKYIDKLFALTQFYRNYYDVSFVKGGCPILNVGIDAKYNNPGLYKIAREESIKLLKGLNIIITLGIKNGEINENIDARVYAQNIYSMIEGSAFMAVTHENKEYMNNILDHIDRLINEKLRK